MNHSNCKRVAGFEYLAATLGMKDMVILAEMDGATVRAYHVLNTVDGSNTCIGLTPVSARRWIRSVAK